MCITVTADAICLLDGGRTLTEAAKAQIVRINAFKRDEIAVDTICVELIGDDGSALEVNEDMRGFDRFEEWLGHLPKVNAEWRAQVVLPPFASSLTNVWVRPE